MFFVFFLTFTTFAQARDVGELERFDIPGVVHHEVTRYRGAHYLSVSSWTGKVVVMEKSSGMYPKTYFSWDGRMVRGSLISSWQSPEGVTFQWLRHGYLYRTEVLRGDRYSRGTVEVTRVRINRQ